MDTSEEATNALLVIFSTGFIFFMQAGFAMIEVGTVREKNSQSILIKNLLDVSAGAISFWLIGYGFAFGQKGKKGGFIGTSGETFAAAGFKRTEFNHF